MPRFLDFFVGTIIRKNLPIPLYIGWGPITAYPHVFVPRSFRSLQFVPEQIEIQYLQSLPGSVAFSRWNRSKNNIFWSLRDSEPYTPLSPSPPPAVPAGPLPAIASYTPTSPLPAPAGPFPSVELYSGQRPGEAMEHFFPRRQQKNEATEARETPQERKSREQRAANAASGEVPGRKGARVYVWEKSSGHFIRTAGGRTRYEDLWEEYGPSQRKYDSFHNEWDLCEAFGPSGGDREDYEWDYDPEDMAEPSRSRPIAPPTIIEDEDVEFDPIALSFDQIVYMRYGCRVEQRLQVPGDLERPLPEITKKLLGDPNLSVKYPEQLETFRTFLAYCNQAKQLSDIPRSLLDFYDTGADIYCEWVVQVRRQVLNNKLYYVVYENRPTDHLYVLLESATTALEIVRQGWGPSLAAVIEKLLGRNIQFLVCFRSRTIQHSLPSVRRQYSGLGFRPKDYHPTVADYQSYVSIREQFLLSPRGRAAKTYGGIVGRLACTTVADEEVLRGPTDDADMDGLCLWDGQSNYAYCDDYLTEEEIDLICGVYHISTGKSYCYFLPRIRS
ncbi:hypothetical protein K438DRAFT_1633654 [Mycena galopus ATCC 62051]|nr:hypothetical protein K438DRAFT_1633654 [Mycena galopus ATCC 62051]